MTSSEARKCMHQDFDINVGGWTASQTSNCVFLQPSFAAAIRLWLKHTRCVHTRSGGSCLKLLSWALCRLRWVILRINNHNVAPRRKRKWSGRMMSSLSWMPFSSAAFHLRGETHVPCGHIWAEWNKSEMTTVIVSTVNWFVIVVIILLLCTVNVDPLDSWLAKTPFDLGNLRIVTSVAFYYLWK